MADRGRVRETIDALARGALVVKGQLFEADAESVTVDGNGVQYQVLLEDVTNAPEIAKTKRGDRVELRLSPNAKVVEKRLISTIVPGLTTAGVFGRLGRRIFVDDCDECSYCIDCTECSYCVCDCDDCSDCLSMPGRFRSWGRLSRGQFRRSVRG